jgi:hypothetical protein
MLCYYVVTESQLKESIMNGAIAYWNSLWPKTQARKVFIKEQLKRGIAGLAGPVGKLP